MNYIHFCPILLNHLGISIKQLIDNWDQSPYNSIKQLIDKEVEMNFDGKVALVAGGTRGIGAATTRILAEQGATVIASYERDAAAAEALAESIRTSGGKMLPRQSDARDPEQMSRLVQEAHQLTGRLDIVVHSVPARGLIRPFLDFTWEDFILAPQTELKSAYELAHAALPVMRAQRSGHFIFVNSDWGRHSNMPGLTSLVLAFGALASLARALALEFGPDGITVNTIAPGMVETQLSANLPPEVRHQIAAITPLRRIATPEDVARVIAFLASDASGFLTGTYIPVNGGIIMD
jgi:3-oxoacyl-[acyl-carrier protein] reductase